MKRSLSCTLPLVVSFVLASAGGAGAAELRVGFAQPYATIQAAIDAASPGDIVIVNDGTYVENILVDKQLTLTSDDYLANSQNDGAVIDASLEEREGHGIEVIADGVTVQGFTVVEAIGMAPVGYRAGIYVHDADFCTVRGNRTGYVDHPNSVGIILYNSNHDTVVDNEVDGAIHGVWVQDVNRSLFRGNTVWQNWNATYSAGFYVIGDYQTGISTTRWNRFVNNQIESNAIGVYLLTWAWNNTIEGNTITGNYIGVLTQDNSKWNVIANNNISGNTNRGVQVWVCGQNTIVGNLIDNNNNGIWFGFSSPSDFAGYECLVTRNTIVNNTWAGVRISANSYGNRLFLNHFANNEANVRSEGTDWSTATAVSYFHGANFSNSLGNYYDTYTGVDLDGDGIGDTDIPFNDGDPTMGPVEHYPLVASPATYNVQAWYLCGEEPLTMYHGGLGQSVGSLEIADGESRIWTSDEPAAGTVAFASGVWRGAIAYGEAPYVDAFTLEIGTSTDGSDFTASGASAVVADGSWDMVFETSAAEVTIPAGHFLAVRLTNSSVASCPVRTGGTSTWISSPGVNDPLWPSGTTDVPGAAATGTSLLPNQPNPFNPRTVLAFELAQADRVRLRIYDLAGRLVRTLLAEEPAGPGRREVVWDGRDDRGAVVASGLYFYRLETSESVLTRRMALVR